MTAKDSDENLMRQVQQGQRDPAGVLVRRYASSLLTFVHRMTGNHHTSEEIVQDAFLSVWNKRHQYRYPKSFRAWLYTIAHNRCRLHFRRKKDLPAEDAGAGLESWDEPGSAVADAEIAGLVGGAVRQLPERQRTVVVLRVWNGLSYAEIAEITKCREATARSHMHQALAAIRLCMEPMMRNQ